MPAFHVACTESLLKFVHSNVTQLLASYKDYDAKISDQFKQLKVTARLPSNVMDILKRHAQTTMHSKEAIGNIICQLLAAVYNRAPCGFPKCPIHVIAPHKDTFYPSDGSNPVYQSNSVSLVDFASQYPENFIKDPLYRRRFR